jgi:hypothetical protein
MDCEIKVTRQLKSLITRQSAWMLDPRVFIDAAKATFPSHGNKEGEAWSQKGHAVRAVAGKGSRVAGNGGEEARPEHG